MWSVRDSNVKRGRIMLPVVEEIEEVFTFCMGVFICTHIISHYLLEAILDFVLIV